MSFSVYGIAPSHNVAQNIVSRLRAKGFARNDISVLFPDRTTTRDFAHEANTKAPEGAAAGASAGGVAGGALGLALGLGLLTIPGAGPFLAAGPIFSTLSGVAVGGALGGLTGALVGLGIPEIEAKRYESKIREGNILLSVHVADSDETDRVRDVFESEGAVDISTAADASVPAS